MSRFASLLVGLAVTFAFGATAFAQAPPDTVRVRGTITSLTGGVLTVAGASTTYKIALPENVAVTLLVKSDLASVGPNSFIGTVAVPQPDGTLKAVEVQILPEALRGRIDGTRPWDSVPSSSMTNATVETIAQASVDKVDGRYITIKYKDTSKKVFVPANAPVVAYTPGDRSALTPGQHVIILGAIKAADGSLSSTSVSVGKDGLVPPM